MKRRDFMMGVAAGAAVFSVAPKAPASERVRHGVIGLGSQGRNHGRTFASLSDCEVVAVCDVDPERRDKSASELKGHGNVQKVDHYRRILDDASIDSVSIATPDHWHVPIALEALMAGKHVYVEKPCAHNIHEAVLLGKAVEKYGKCVQHGTQSRSGEGIREAVQFLREGGIGKVRLAKAINHQLREPIGRAPVSDPPAGVDYDLWTGPAPLHPFTQNRWHYNWHWFWDYGTGDIGNDGIHQIDVARWGLGVELPEVANASGGQLFYEDDHETPDTQTVTFEYPHCYLVYEMRLWTDYDIEGHDNGVVFYGDKGTLEVGRRGCEVTLIGEEKKLVGGGADFSGNIRNFVECVKNNAPDALNAPIREGVLSTTLCHLGNISTRVGRRLRYDSETHSIQDDSEANALLARSYRKGYELAFAG